VESALSPELGRAADVRARLESEFEAVLARAATADFVNKLCYAFLRVRLPDFLAMEDRLAMAQGMEARVPLADARLVELVAGLPSAVKMGAGGEKALLRDHVASGLPAEVRGRVKSPFPVPLEASAFYAHALGAIGPAARGCGTISIRSSGPTHQDARGPPHRRGP
jgi:asparagine synthetase B (glutamine-hydrolysing)